MAERNAPESNSARSVLLLLAALAPLAGCVAVKSSDFPPLLGSIRTQPVRSDAESALRLARATREAGDLGSAVKLYRSLVAKQKPSAELLVEFGDVLLDSGAPDDAIDTYSQVRSGSSARLGALLGVTRAHLALAEPAKAMETITQAQGLEPQDPRVLVDRGVVLDALGQHAEAQASYRAVLAVAPRDVSARNDLALSLAVTGQYDEAIALMGPLVRSSVATPRIRENMALIYGLKGDTEQAAAISRIDLDEAATKENLQFFAAVR